MTSSFDSFVIFAEMRTGSNFLETNLNAIEGVSCHGEAFNPHFIGYPDRQELLGITLAERDRRPHELLDRLRSRGTNLSGFRYFHDHDPRVLDAILDDTNCAKTILTRNPAESYVSWKIARTTGQWKLTDVKRRKAARAVFDATDFADYLEALQNFQLKLHNRLQASGQTAFYISYEDLQSKDMINGLAAYLGVPGRLEKLDSSLKVQNPAPLASKVSNFAEMETALSKLDRFNLTRTPNFEPRRLAAVPSYVACANTGLLYLPLKGGPVDPVTEWMAALDGVARDDLITGMSQKDLRQWKRRHKGQRTFTVLRHPVARAHHVFCSFILGQGPRVYEAIRHTLIKRYGLGVPEAGVDDTYDLDRHKAAFLTFLGFLRENLTGQTSIRVDAAWCTQAQALQGFAQFALPDLVIRESEMQEDLPAVAARLGVSAPPAITFSAKDTPFALKDVYDEEIEHAVAQAYQRDYMMFGFERWS
ncbi:nodulation protein NodH [Roseobacter sp. YSTF-M11]|uniref:Nodulation protein NodH n=1 Tax=Roseobacter insulae TaxID=2859783 RepID=A0A9X1FS93_9RHOB|nr:nodulation protein NodH [Roseobacter insulae]MBW4706836.1 nodulation protein NodH [Roseobacter insulae]